MQRAWLWVSSFVAVVACGGSTVTNTDGTHVGGGGGTGGGAASGGAGGAGAGGIAGAAGMGAACDVVATTSGPYSVQFTLQNGSAAPVYLWQGCDLEHQLFACSSGYSAPLTTSLACSSPCGSGGSCVLCGACQSAPLLVAPGASHELDWPGLTYTFGTDGGCSCYIEHVAPAGKYRITLPVYDTMPPNGGPMPAAERFATLDFDLAATGVSWTVALGK